MIMYKESRRILFAGIRNYATFPPTISAVNYLNKGNKVSVFSYYIAPGQFEEGVQCEKISDRPYPTSFLKRTIAKLSAFFIFYRFLFKHANEFDVIWLAAWDYPLLKKILFLKKFKGKLVYQMHELEPEKFRYAKKADFVIVPDENRGWISYFLGGFKRPPLVLPNIPYIPSNLKSPGDTEFSVIKKQRPEGTKFILYQGFLDYEKRCLLELLQSLQLLPEYIELVIMPANASNNAVIKRINDDSEALGIRHRVHILKSVIAPLHLLSVAEADVGIGLYRPTSLNQIYAAPNRIYEFTYFGIPLILPDFPHFRMLEGKYPYAINTASPENVNEIANVIREILESNNHMVGKSNAKLFFQIEGNFEQRFNRVWETITEN